MEVTSEKIERESSRVGTTIRGSICLPGFSVYLNAACQGHQLKRLKLSSEYETGEGLPHSERQRIGH